MSGQQPVIQVVPKPQANDHLYLTVALIFLCLLLNCNTLGALCLIPGLICAAVVGCIEGRGPNIIIMYIMLRTL